MYPPLPTPPSTQTQTHARTNAHRTTSNGSIDSRFVFDPYIGLVSSLRVDAESSGKPLTVSVVSTVDLHQKSSKTWGRRRNFRHPIILAEALDDPNLRGVDAQNASARHDALKNERPNFSRAPCYTRALQAPPKLFHLSWNWIGYWNGYWERWKLRKYKDSKAPPACAWANSYYKAPRFLAVRPLPPAAASPLQLDDIAPRRTSWRLSLHT